MAPQAALCGHRLAVNVYYVRTPTPYSALILIHYYCYLRTSLVPQVIADSLYCSRCVFETCFSNCIWRFSRDEDTCLCHSFSSMLLLLLRFNSQRSLTQDGFIANKNKWNVQAEIDTRWATFTELLFYVVVGIYSGNN